MIWKLEEKYNDIHFIFDDVCNDVITKDVLGKMNWCLHDVIIIQKSMRTERQFIKEGESYNLESNIFNNLDKDLLEDFEHHHLSTVIRLSKENHALVECAEKIIEKQIVEVQVQTKSKLSAEIAPIVSSHVSHALNESKEETERNFHSGRSGSSDHNPIESGNVDDDPVKQNSMLIFDFDMALRKLPNLPISNNNDTQDKIITSFNFVYGPTDHQNISGKRPELVFLPVASREVITVILSLIISVHFESRFPLLIANSLEKAKTLYDAAKIIRGKNTMLHIPYLQEIHSTMEEKDKVLRNSFSDSENILVTDHRSFIGMESESIITLIDPTEKQLRHSLVEMTSRCSSELLIFLLPYTAEETAKPGTVGEIIKAWERNDLVETKRVTIQQTDIEAKSGIHVSSDESDTGHIKVFTQSEEFLSRLNIIGNYGNNNPFIKTTNMDFMYRYDVLLYFFIYLFIHGNVALHYGDFAIDVN